MNSTQQWKIAGIVATAVIILSVPLYLWRVDRTPLTEGLPTDAATFSGSQKCAECHKTQYDLWKGSHHDLAMDAATQETVLGDFSDAVFSYFGSQSRFYRKGDQFWVHTQGPQGEMGVFQVLYVFGAYPLQQILFQYLRKWLFH